MVERAPLLTDDDLQAVVGAGGTRSVEDPRLREAARAASADFRAAIRHPLSAVIGEEVEFDGTGTRVLRLGVLRPRLDRVEIDGRDIPVEDVQVSKIGLARRRDGAVWPYGYGNIVVTMNHGLTEVPEDVRSALLEAVVLRLTVPTGLKQFSLGNQSFTAETLSGGTTQKWADAVENYALANGDRA